MIRVVVSDPSALEGEALLRSVGTDMEACTPGDQRLGTQAGADVLERLRSFGEVPVGGALVTPGGGLRAPFLIHVVIRSREEAISARAVGQAFLNGLRRAAEWELGTLVVPPIGIGAGNLDAEASARVMLSVLREHLAASPFPREVVISVATAYEKDAFLREVSRAFPPSEEGPARGSEEEAS